MSAHDLYHELGAMAEDAAVVVDTGTEWVDVLGFRLVSDDEDGKIYEVITDDVVCPKCRAEAAQDEADTRGIAAWLADVTAATHDDTYDPEGDDFGTDSDYMGERTDYEDGDDSELDRENDDAAWEAYVAAESFDQDIDAELSDEVRSRTVLNLCQARGQVMTDLSPDLDVVEAIAREILRVLG